MRYRLQVLGIGSPIGDDRVGWSVIEQLCERVTPHYRLRLEALDRPGASLVEQLALADETWLVDALRGPPPGILLHPSHALLASGERTSSHGFGLSDTLSLAQALGQLPERLELFAISISNPDPLSSQLTEPVRRAADCLSAQLAERIGAQIRNG